jgi:hypothetical protein
MARDDDSLPVGVMQILENRLRPFVGRELTEINVRRISDVVKESNKEFKRSGFPFAPLVPVVLRRFGWIKLVRGDLPHLQIQRLILQIIQQFPAAHPLYDIAPAIRGAFPRYNPADAEAAHHRFHTTPRPHFGKGSSAA